MERTSLPMLIGRLRDTLTRQLLDSGTCLQQLPIEEYVAACIGTGAEQSSAAIPPLQASTYQCLLHRYGLAVAATYNRLALVQLAERRASGHECRSLPAPLRDELEVWLHDLCGDIETDQDKRFDIAQHRGAARDDLLKDFAVCAGRAIPVGGAWVVEKRWLRDADLFGLEQPSPGAQQKPIRPVRASLKGIASSVGLLPSIRRVRNAWEGILGRNRCYLVIHTSQRRIRYFSPGYHEQAYRNIALLLERNPGLAGVYRCSWFLDPAVIEMEPRLGFLLELPLANKARHGPVGPVDPTQLTGILVRSRVRTEAYNEGRYVPWLWAYLWLRDDLLDWSKPLSQAQGQRSRNLT